MNALEKTDLGHNQWLDVLRFLAAFLVVIGHARNDLFVQFADLESSSRTIITAGFFVLTRLGHEAVLIFFALSGYLVGGRLIMKADKPGWNGLGDWVVDRISRIWLPLGAAVALTLLLEAASDGHASTLTVLSHFVGLNGVISETLHNNAPLWTLAYEI